VTTIDGLAFDRDEEVAILRIDRQDRGNSLDTAFHARLADAYASIKADRSIRAIVLTGAGERFFCSGQDLRETADAGGPAQRKRGEQKDAQAVQRAGPMRHDIWLPFIVSVNGTCAGSGFHFIADADIVIASPNASFVDTHCAVGQVSVLEPLNLLHRVSVGELLRLVVLGRAGRIDAQEALRISLVNEVVEGNLLARAVELGHAASRNSPSAVEASKRALWAAAREPMRPYLQYGWDLLRAQWTHPDSTEGARAFVEKRDPVWVTEVESK
jgi:E-phenylitaconyl-CoA hydratase